MQAMRKVLSYITIAVAAALVSSCMDFNVNLVEPQGPAKVTLQLRNADLVATRAVTEDNAFNEDLLVNAQCFFTATDSDVVLYATDLLTIGANQTKTLDIEIPAEKITSLFGTTTKCDVYVVANYGSKITDSSIATIQEKTIALGTGATQDSFVMDGEAEVTLNGTALSGAVDLYRAAAKIVVKANIISSVSEGGKNWLPSTSKIKLTYTGSVNGSKISAQPADANAATEVSYTQETNVFSSFTTETESDGTTKHVGYQATPFYSFPVAADANEGSIKMVIPWTPAGGTEIEYTYQIPVNIALERNHVYIIEVDVETLGNLDGATLTPSYTVVDWTENAITAGLSRPKYLVVNQHSYVMNNETYLEIPFMSSDDCIISSITCKQTNLKSSQTTTVTRNDSATEVTNKTYKAIIDNTTNKISITHGLNNDIYDNKTDGGNGIFDFTPYEFVVVIQHQTNANFKETITITQYPAMYGTANQNSDYANSGGTNDDNGFVWVNGYQGYPSSNVTNFGGAFGANDDDLDAVCMYTITTTSLPSGSDYIIGDPRTLSVSVPTTWNGNNIVWATAPDLNGTSRKLQNYYPTDAVLSDGANSPTYNMIAPKFRVCSAYGAIANDQTNRRYYDNVKGRCASYQEDGYPAGRWRLPTKAEFEIINTLTNSGFLPTLFVTTMDYWCAHGYGRYDTSDNKVELTHNDSDHGNPNYYGSVSVRCVYDEWYWGSEPALTTEAQKDVFTWGDLPR